MMTANPRTRRDARVRKKVNMLAGVSRVSSASVRNLEPTRDALGNPAAKEDPGGEGTA